MKHSNHAGLAAPAWSVVAGCLGLFAVMSDIVAAVLFFSPPTAIAPPGVAGVLVGGLVSVSPICAVAAIVVGRARLKAEASSRGAGSSTGLRWSGSHWPWALTGVISGSFALAEKGYMVLWVLSLAHSGWG